MYTPQNITQNNEHTHHCQKLFCVFCDPTHQSRLFPNQVTTDVLSVPIEKSTFSKIFL